MVATSQKDAWDKLQALSIAAASILVPLAVVFVGNQYSAAMKESENRVKYLELAVSILRVEPKKENRALRDWAADVLTHHSPVPLSPEAQKQLKDQRIDFALTKGFSAGYLNFGPYKGGMTVPEDRDETVPKSDQRKKK